MRIGSRAVVLALVGWLAGCSADRWTAAPPAGITTPLGVPSAAPSPVAARGAAPRPTDSLDPAELTPLLSQPGLEVAADADAAGDPGRAAREIEAAIARNAVTGPAVEWQLLVGSLKEAASDPAGALVAYEAAAREPWTLSGYAELGAGRVLVALSRGAEAAAHLRRVPSDWAAVREARPLLAEALVATGQADAAIATLREQLSTAPPGEDGAPTGLRLSQLLLARAEAATADSASRSADAVEALGLSRRVLLRGKGKEALARAAASERRALAALPSGERAHHARPSRDAELERLRTLVDAQVFDDALAAGGALLDSLGEAGHWSTLGCEAELLRARALSGTREHRRAESLLLEIARRCDDRDVRARALFLSGKAATAERRFAEAVLHYGAVERECPEHRLADDARLKAALCYREMGAEGRFTDLLTRMADDYPDGDMLKDGLFELAVRRMEKSDWASAATVLERAVARDGADDVARGLEASGRERYFLARAWIATGETERGLAAYEAIVREHPLSYYTLHAYSRLAEASAPRAEAALSAALGSARESPFAIAAPAELDSPGFRRALALLRVADVPRAVREVDALGLLRSGATPRILWAVALLYGRGGAARAAQEVARSLSDYLGRWPSGEWTRAWQLAFPRPFHSLVHREAARSGVAESLVYAVMREESSFDPAAESPAGAHGLMQLIEPTARRYGKKLGLPGNAAALKVPAVNIPIACRLLGDLTQSFDENPLLAIPGYNAGPGRPRRWIAQRAAMDFDLWVELIPYQETRRYTKRVLSSRAAYAFLYEDGVRGAALLLPRSAGGDAASRQP